MFKIPFSSGKNGILRDDVMRVICKISQNSIFGYVVRSEGDGIAIYRRDYKVITPANLFRKRPVGFFTVCKYGNLIVGSESDLAVCIGSLSAAVYSGLDLKVTGFGGAVLFGIVSGLLFVAGNRCQGNGCKDNQ